jgi:surface polysaccharide O-acyltransferase-like enzyme
LIFGIYLVHPFFILLSKHLESYNAPLIQPNIFMQIMTISFQVFLMSFFTCLLITKIPFVRRII